MKSLIAIALVYSYIVNKERVIPDYSIMSFINDVKSNLINLRSTVNIDDEEFERIWDKLPFEIETIDRDTNRVRNLDDYSSEELEELFGNNWSSVKYRLKSLDYIFINWYSYLPPDLVSATVQSNALHHLDIEHSRLPIKSEEVTKSGDIVIYGLDKKLAHERAVASLESCDFRDIHVGGGMICQPDDKGFNFYFTGKHDIDEVDYRDKSFSEPIEVLRTILDLENYKREVLSKKDENGLLPLDEVFLGRTALLDKDDIVISKENRAVIKLTGDEDAFYSRRFKGGISSDVSVFIDLLSDDTMSLISQGKLQGKKYESVVEEITLLSEMLGSNSATLEDIEKYVEKSNKKPPMKELK